MRIALKKIFFSRWRGRIAVLSLKSGSKLCLQPLKIKASKAHSPDRALLKKCLFQGFSLLELLFVVAILALVATLGLAFYRQQTLNAKINRTALEIQEILKKGAIFFIHKEEWPVLGYQSGDVFEKNYLPNGKVPSNPWGGNYQYKPFARKPAEFEKKRLFQVETLVPTESIAVQIAAQLANAEVEPVNPFYKVKAQMIVPGQSENENKVKHRSYLFRSIGSREITKENNVDKITFQACPKDMKPGLLAGLSNIDSGPRSALVFWTLETFEIINKKCDTNQCEFSLNMLYWWEIRGGRTGYWIPNAKATVQYIIYCEPTVKEEVKP